MNEAQQLILALMNKPENKICADCKSKLSEWASTTLGVFVCIDCSGVHRSLGTHITLVRSCTLDSWTMKLASHMAQIGNAAANDYWERNLPPDFKRPQCGNLSQISLFIKQKYMQRRWVADGPSPNEMLDNMAKPHSAPQIKMRRKHRKQPEEKPESIASRIKELKRGTQAKEKKYVIHSSNARVKQAPKEDSDSDPFSGAGEPGVVAQITLVSKPEIEEATKPAKKVVEEDSDDDFYSETKPKSEAAKALMNKFSPPVTKSAPAATPCHHQRRSVQQAKPQLKFHSDKQEDFYQPLYQPPKQAPKTNKDKLEDFFNMETERAPIASKPTIIRSGNRLRRAQEEKTKSKISARLRQKIEKRTKEVPLQRAPLRFAEGDNQSDSSSSDPFS